MNSLNLIRGKSFHLTDNVVINNPKLEEIVEFGEEKYWSVISQICATSFDHILSLAEMNIDYQKISDWQMFLMTKNTFTQDKTSILLPGLNIPKLIAVEHQKTKEIFLIDRDNENIILNETIFNELTHFIRECHHISRNYKIPGNKAALNVYLDDARNARLKTSTFKSTLAPLISALCNYNGFKYNYETVWNISIYALMNSAERIRKIEDASTFAYGMYSGNLDLKKMGENKIRKRLDWMGELN